MIGRGALGYTNLGDAGRTTLRGEFVQAPIDHADPCVMCFVFTRAKSDSSDSERDCCFLLVRP